MTQILRDFRDRPQADKRGPEDRRADQAAWLSSARQFLHQAADAEGRDGKTRKLQRIASHDQLLALDNLLCVSTGQGLSFYERPREGDEEEVDPQAYPAEDATFLVVHCDQHSVNMALLSYLIFQRRLVVLPVYDTFHRQWNDLAGAVTASGNMGHVMCFLVVCNAMHGPWQSTAFFNEVKEGARSLLEIMTSEDPLLTQLLPDILRDSGEEHRLTEEGIAEEVLQRLRQANFLARRGEKISTSRW